MVRQARAISSLQRPKPASSKSCTSMTGIASISLTLRLVDDADMRGDDAPPFRKARPGLHLPANLARRIGATEQGRRYRQIAPVGGDLHAVQSARQPDRRARGAKGADLF